MRCSAPVFDREQPETLSEAWFFYCPAPPGCFKGDCEVYGEAQQVFLALAQPVQQSPLLGLPTPATGFQVILTAKTENSRP
jgi:hypothetical protein